MLTRREFLQAGIAAPLALGAAGGAKPAPQSRPIVRGCLWWYDPGLSAQWKVEGWRQELEEEQGIAFNLLWLANTPAAFHDGLDGFRQLLSLCERRRMKVMVDVWRTPDWYTQWDGAKEMDLIRQDVAARSALLRDSPAFFGWYVPHEIYFWPRKGKEDVYIRGVYSAAIQACHAATPGKPVTVSPFFILDRTKTFGDFYVPSPEEYLDYWASLLKEAPFDIVMLQDSGEHFAWVTDDQRRPYLKAMRDACRKSGSRFWGNVECAEMNFASIEDYIRVNGRVHHGQAKEPRWRPVPMGRFVSKLRTAAEFTDQFVTWGYMEFCRPSLSAGAAKWYADYKSYVKAGVF